MAAHLPPALTSLLEAPPSERWLDGFELLAPLGRGGFAPVWLAREVRKGVELRDVALKLFALEPEGGGLSAEELEAEMRRVVAEARSLCRIEHPCVVRFYSLPESRERGVVGLAMELVRGRSLGGMLAERRRLSVAEVLAVGLAVGAALDAVHAAGVVHRDVKPANVMETGGSYKLIDFGIARAGSGRARDPSAPRLLHHDLPADAAGNAQSEMGPYVEGGSAGGDSLFGVAGTVGYVDPVCVATLAPAVVTSDLYSLGATLFHCLTGQVPSAAGAPAGTGLRGAVLDGRESPPPLAELAPELPRALAALVDRLVSPERARRPASAREVIVALEAVQRELVGAAPPEPPPPAAPELPASSAGGAVVVGGPNTVASRFSVAFLGLWVLGLGVALGLGMAGAFEQVAKPAVLDPLRTASWTPTLPPPLPVCPEGMVALRGGSFVMGTMSKWEGDMDERPAHGVHLTGFCLDRTEVTVGAYRGCVDAGACGPMPRTARHEDGDRGGEARDSLHCNGPRQDREEHPINCVDWPSAAAFCQFRGARLPTETEWEVAARGAERRKYPFSDRLPLGPNLLNGLDRRARDLIGKPSWPVLLEADDGHETTAPVGSYPDGATPEGVLDLAGNVWEWVADGYAPYPESEVELRDPRGPTEGPATPRKVLRGGGYLVSNPSMIRAAQRNANPPYMRVPDVGFRCARGGLPGGDGGAAPSP